MSILSSVIWLDIWALLCSLRTIENYWLQWNRFPIATQQLRKCCIASAVALFCPQHVIGNFFRLLVFNQIPNEWKIFFADVLANEGKKSKIYSNQIEKKRKIEFWTLHKYFGSQATIGADLIVLRLAAAAGATIRPLAWLCGCFDVAVQSAVAAIQQPHVTIADILYDRADIRTDRWSFARCSVGIGTGIQQLVDVAVQRILLLIWCWRCGRRIRVECVGVSGAGAAASARRLSIIKLFAAVH